MRADDPEDFSPTRIRPYLPDGTRRPAGGERQPLPEGLLALFETADQPHPVAEEWTDLTREQGPRHSTGLRPARYRLRASGLVAAGTLALVATVMGTRGPQPDTVAGATSSAGVGPHLSPGLGQAAPALPSTPDHAASLPTAQDRIETIASVSELTPATVPAKHTTTPSRAAASKPSKAAASTPPASAPVAAGGPKHAAPRHAGAKRSGLRHAMSSSSTGSHRLDQSGSRGKHRAQQHNGENGHQHRGRHRQQA